MESILYFPVLYIGRKDTWLRVCSSIIAYQRVKMKEENLKMFIIICFYQSAYDGCQQIIYQCKGCESEVLSLLIYSKIKWLSTRRLSSPFHSLGGDLLSAGYGLATVVSETISRASYCLGILQDTGRRTKEQIEWTGHSAQVQDHRRS